MFGPVKVGFLKFNACVEQKGSKLSLPGIVFMRGGSVGIIVVIECKETGQKYTLLTKQARVPIGQELLEIPAGMLDGSGDFGGVAVKELREETGISISTKHLVNLSDGVCSVDPGKPKGIYLSPGGCDEFMTLYSYTTKMSLKEINGLKGKLTGEIHEGESIKLVVKRLDELPKIVPDAKSLAAYMLYMQKCDPEKPDLDVGMVLHARTMANIWIRSQTKIKAADMVNYSKDILRRNTGFVNIILAAKTVAGLTDDELAALKEWAISSYVEKALEELST